LLALMVVCIAVVLIIIGYNLIIGYLMNNYAENSNKDPKSGIMKSAEPIILKNDSFKKAALLIHGFIGSPTDYAKLPQILHDRGYAVYAPLLPGHGTDPRDFSKTTDGELEQFVLNQYQTLKREYDEVALIGFSMGGALSVLTAAQEPVDKLILLAPYFKISHQWYYILPAEFYQETFMNIVPYTYRPLMFKQINNKDAIPYITDYDFVSLKGAHTAIKLGEKAIKAVKNMNQPTLIIHALGDKATDYKTSKKIADRLSGRMSCKFVTLYKSNHIIMHDYESNAVTDSIINFLNKN